MTNPKHLQYAVMMALEVVSMDLSSSGCSSKEDELLEALPVTK